MKHFKYTLSLSMDKNTLVFLVIIVIIFFLTILASSKGSLVTVEEYNNCSCPDRYNFPSYWSPYHDIKSGGESLYTITQYRNESKCYTVSDCVQNMSLDGCYYDGCNWCCGNTCTVRQCVEIVET